MMRVLIAGARGQLGTELLRTCPNDIVAEGHDRTTLDVTDADAVTGLLRGGGYDLVINASAYTAVDRAEQEPEAVFAVNQGGAANLAAAAAAVGARFIHVSTDFIFDGAQSRPYGPAAAARPLGVYGASKLAGEEAVRRLHPEPLIVRTAWIYSAHGGNFVKTMLRLLAERDQVGVVADQIGTPTWARNLAQALWRAGRQRLTGTHHWTDGGVASWYDLAVAVREEGIAAGLLQRRTPIHAIRTEDYPTPARRPAYSVLDKGSMVAALELEPVHWQAALRDMLFDLKVQSARHTTG